MGQRRSIAAVLVLVACQASAGPERELSGERIYQRHCARCHGVDGRPTREMPTARDLTIDSYMKTVSDEQIKMVIQRGKPPQMPGFGMQFAEPSMKVLVAYVRSLSDPEVVGATRPPGEDQRE